MRKRILLVFVALAAAIGLFTYFLSLPYLGTLAARALLASRIPDDRTLTFDEARIWLWTGELQLENPALSEAGRPRDDFIRADRLDLGISWWKLLHGNIVFHRLELHSPRIRVVHLGGNRYNFSSLFRAEPRLAEDPERKPVAVSIRDLLFRDATLGYRDPGRQIEGMLRQAEARIALATGPELEVDGTLRIPSGHVTLRQRPYPVRDAQAAFGFRGGRLAIERAAAGVGAGQVNLAGSVRSAADPVLALTFAARAPLRWVQDWTDRSAEGLLEARGRLEGPVSNLGGKGTLALPSGRFEGVALRDASARWRLERRTFQIEAVSARALGGQVAGSAWVGVASGPPFGVDATGKDVDLSHLERLPGFDRARWEGEGDVRLQLEGRGGEILTYRGALQAEAAGKVRRADARDEAIPVRAAADLSLDSGAFILDRLRAQIADSTAEAGGTFDLTGATDIWLRGLVRHPGRLARLAGAPGIESEPLIVTGSVRGTRGRFAVRATADSARATFRELAAVVEAGATFDGTLRFLDPPAGRPAIRGTGDLRIRQASLGRQDLGVVQAAYRLAWPPADRGGISVVIPSWSADLGIRGSARIEGRRYAFDARTDRLAFRELATLRDLPMTGALEARASKDLDEARAQADLTLHDVVFRGEPLGEARARLGIGPRDVLYQADLWDGSATLRGRTAFDPGLGTSAALRMTDAELSPILAIAAALTPGADPTHAAVPDRLATTGSIDLAGPLRRPPDLTGQVALSRLEIVYPDVSLRNRGPLRLSLREQGLTVERLALQGEGTELQVDGRLALEGPSSLQASGMVNLGWLERLFPAQFVDARGEATFRALFTGTWGAIDWRGLVEVDDGRFQARALPQPLEDVHGRIHLTPDGLVVESLSSQAGPGGLVVLDGIVRFVGMRPDQVRMGARGTNALVRLPGFQGFYDFNLLLAGTPDRTRLAGDVRVKRAVWTRDLPEAPDLLAPGRARLPVPTGFRTDLPYLRSTELLLAVQADEALHVDNNRLDVELRGDLLVRGTLAAPEVLGHVEVLSGEAYLAGQTYQVERARVDFLPPDWRDPQFDVVAAGTIRDREVRVAAHGTLTRFVLDLSSEPPLPQEDLLVLVTTGQTTGELAEAFGRGILPEVAGRLLGYLEVQAAERLAAGLRALTGLEELRLDPETGLRVGRRLTEQTVVRFAASLRGAPERILIVEHALTDDLDLTIRRDLAGPTYGSLRYRHDIR